MKVFTVVVAPTAQDHIDAIASWWRENRPKNPTLFDDEFEKAIEQLRTFPNAALPYRSSPEGMVRRLLLRGSRYYVYCQVFEDSSIVHVVAVWHVSRGAGPTL